MNKRTLKILCIWFLSLPAFAELSASLESMGTRNARTSYQDLPKAGAMTSNKPWSGSYWPTFKGGISFRWQTMNFRSADFRQFLYQIPTYDQITRMGQAQKNQLSPSEKLDYALGNINMSLTHAERNNMLSARRVDPRSGIETIEPWNGYCHGTAPGSILEKEPLNPVPVNVRGRKEHVVFYPDDIKALVSAYYAHAQNSKVQTMMGARCEQEFKSRPLMDFFMTLDHPECRDANPAQFHLLLVDHIQKNKSFIAEIEQGSEVWNYAVTGYRVLPERRLLGGKKDRRKILKAPSKKRIQLELQYASGIEPGQDTRHLRPGTINLDYTLWLNARGQIVGGKWNFKKARVKGEAFRKPGGKWVDFLWTMSEVGQDSRGLLHIETIRWLIDQSRI